MSKELRIHEGKAFKHWLFSSLLTFFLMAGSFLTCWAGGYPNHPINMVIGFAPGGGTDLGSRIIADKMGEFLGQPLVPINKPGGSGALAASFVAKGKQDGYTILATIHSIFFPPEVKKVDYKLDDFIFTGVWATAPYFVMVRADSKWKNLKEFIEDAKKAPGKLSCSHGGTNSATHFWYMIFSKYTGVELSLVPYKSCGEAVTALLGGHVDTSFCAGVGVISESSLVRTLASGEGKRLEDLPDIPTVSEFGYPAKFSSLYTFAFPKGTPKEVVNRFSEAQKKALEKYSKEIAEGLKKVQMYPASLSPGETYSIFKNRYNELCDLVKEMGPAGKSSGK